MEEGSLVQEALQRMQEQRDHGLLQQNTLVVDVFLLLEGDMLQQERIEQFQKLAQLAKTLNDWIQSYQWKWHAGGEGMVFGVHATNKIPHLRATCRYQESIEDEWFAIAVILRFTALHHDIAVECWDLDDGQVLLIESAPVLPSWVDEVGPQACRHVCWIQEGKIKIIKAKTPNLQQREALQILCHNNDQSDVAVVVSPPEVQTAICNRVEHFLKFLEQPPPLQSNSIPPQHVNYFHRAPFILPQRVALLLQKRPELVHCAVQAYCQSCFQNKETKLGQHIAFRDLQWTTLVMGRTSYAMLRTISNECSASSSIPNEYKSVETNRMKRACQVQSTPHLRHALQNGIRIMAGLEYLLSQETHIKEPTTNEEHIVQHWSRIDVECGGNGKWLIDSWQAGPNGAAYDLTNLMKCPVYDKQVANSMCPLTYPGVILKDQIKSQLKEDHKFVENVPPRPQDVDDEAWLELESVQAMDEIMMETVTSKSVIDPVIATCKSVDTRMQPAQVESPNKENSSQVKSLDTMLDSFQAFVASEKSDVQGVTHDTVENDIDPEALDNVQINPRVFMDLLHTVLKSEPEEISSLLNNNVQDPYFSKEDYDLMEEGESSSDENKSDSEGGEVESIKAAMKAMDDELRGTQASLVMDQVQDEQISTDNVDEEVAFNTHVLSNLLKSLDAGSGGPGPVQNILAEMGANPPKLAKEPPDDLSE